LTAKGFLLPKAERLSTRKDKSIILPAVCFILVASHPRKTSVALLKTYFSPFPFQNAVSYNAIVKLN
jgi:hypothetical protein